MHSLYELPGLAGPVLGKRLLFLIGAFDVIQDGRQGGRHLRCDSKFEFIEKVRYLHFLWSECRVKFIPVICWHLEKAEKQHFY